MELLLQTSINYYIYEMNDFIEVVCSIYNAWVVNVIDLELVFFVFFHVMH